MKFKVGNIVKIICADEQTSSSGTRKKVGQVGKIVKFSGVNNMPYSISFADDDEIFNFMEKEIGLNIKIGEQLLFSFMKD